MYKWRHPHTWVVSLGESRTSCFPTWRLITDSIYFILILLYSYFLNFKLQRRKSSCDIICCRFHIQKKSVKFNCNYAEWCNSNKFGVDYNSRLPCIFPQKTSVDSQFMGQLFHFCSGLRLYSKHIFEWI